MIPVDRQRVFNPISTELMHKSLDLVSDWYQLQGSRTASGAREPQILRTKINREARQALNDLFHGKCGFCESDIAATGTGEVQRFRPFTDATDLDGRGSPHHYAWLAFDWENLFLICAACSRAKRTLFPVDGNRASPMTPLREVRAFERALLIDPCVDEPFDHLHFQADGFVAALTPIGETTIKVFNLNRQPLVIARQATWNRAERLHRLGSILNDMASDAAPYAAVVRTFLNNQEAAEESPDDQISVSRFTAYAVLKDTRSADETLARDLEAFRLNARTIRKIQIRNFKSISFAEIDLRDSSSDAASWLMLLGENSVGKSSILQAIALTLAGADEANRICNPQKVLPAHADYGEVTVWFLDQDSPAELSYERSSSNFHGTRGPSAIVLAYGAHRYAERRTRSSDPTPTHCRVSPIIEPVGKIRYAGKWLNELETTQFISAQRTLQSLVPPSEKTVLIKGNSSACFNVDDYSGPLSGLSAGYQTIIGICADIMRLLFELWNTLGSATAIVLLDEIDAHLHPQWAMRIVRALRNAFPQVQFISSTHNPLALRGLKNGEVALVQREAGAVIVDQNLPRIEGMQVEDLLTSRIFGLSSTTDPETEALLGEYFHLLSLPPTREHNDRISEIRELVNDREALGRNEPERLLLRAAQRLINAANHPVDPRSVPSEQTRQMVEELFAQRYDIRPKPIS